MENPLARRLLAGEFTDGDTVIVDVQENDDGKLEPIFAARPPEPIAVELPVVQTANGK